jgi:ATP-dependent Lhr-like helicase
VEWERTGKLIRGKFRREAQDPEWCSRRVVEIGRRRALAALRKQIEAVELPHFAAFMQRWQHLGEREQLDGAAGTATAMRQLYGIARPPVAWDRDYLRARVRAYDPTTLSEFTATGEPVWVGEGNYDPESGAIPLARVRFFERGTGGIWLDEQPEPALSENAETVRATIAEEGASFIGDIQAVTGLTMLAVREAIRELVAWGLVTNDTVEAMREIARWKSMVPRTGADPTSWLPADYTPSPNRRFIRARPNVRRLPKWRRPDRPGAGGSGWTGRWSLVRRRGTMGPDLPEEERAERIARQWLARYGIVSSDWWRRERPAVSWRSIYRELKRLEFRGEVRRGYFVKGLGGAQFALPDAVEWLRAVANEDQSLASFVVMAASDPANVYNLRLELVDKDPLSRPRGSGALIVTRGGRVAIAVEGRGRRFSLADWLSAEEITAAKKALVEHLRGEKSARYLM